MSRRIELLTGVVKIILSSLIPVFVVGLAIAVIAILAYGFMIVMKNF